MRLPRLTVYHVVVIPLAIASVLLALMFLRFTTTVETDELRHRLNALAVRSEALDTSDLLPRLKAELALVRARPLRRELPRDELGLLAAFAERRGKAPLQPAAFFGATLLRNVIHALQRMSGIEPVQHLYAESGIDLLTLAYNLERRRLYSEALLVLQRAGQAGVAREAHDFILLHSGYCLFFLGQRYETLKSWQSAAQSPVARNQALALSLLQWLKSSGPAAYPASFKALSPRARAHELYRVMAFKESLEVLLTVADGERDQAYYFLRGRVNESPGNFPEAAADYRRTIAMNPRNELATVASRRLYLMGVHYRPDVQQSELAPRLSIALGDSDFLLLAQSLLHSDREPMGRHTDEAGGNELESLIRQVAGKIRAPVSGPAQKLSMVRIRTRNGSVITGVELRRKANETTLRNENGTFRIPAADIESRENLSGN